MFSRYSIKFDRVHFRASRLTYSDGKGQVTVYLEESAVSEWDWIGAEPDFNLPPKRLAKVLANIQQWAAGQGIRIKIWKEEELGIP